jgi:DNA-binding response OmpR family regulator
MSTNSGYLLIVEDDPDIRKLLNTTLAFKGHRVITTINGREALEVVQKERPAVVITDIMMPDLDGFGLVHRLRIAPETRNVPVVFITATYVTPEDKEFALNIGATRFIQKPVDIEMFLNTVSELLEAGASPTIPKPLNEFEFYDGYRQRLEVKLDQKIKQIAREEHILANRSEAEDQGLQVSLRHAIKERDELKALLEQIRKQLAKIQKPE